MNDVLDLLSLTRTRWRAYTVAFVSLAIGTGLILLIPSRVGQVVALLPRLADPQLGAQLYRPALEIAGFSFLQAITTSISSYLGANASERIANDLRIAFFRNLINRPLDTCSQKQLGEIASEFASDIVLIQGGLAETLFGFLRNAIFASGALTLMFLVSPQMTAITLAGVIVIALSLLGLIKVVTRAAVSVQRHRGKTVALLLEAASNAYVIQAYERTDYMIARFAVRLGDTLNQVQRQMRLMSGVNPIGLIMLALIVGGTLYFGVAEVRRGELTAADLVTYLTYALVLVSSVMNTGQLAGRMQQAGAMLAKHHELIATMREGSRVPPAPAVASVPAPRGGQRDQRTDAPGYVLESVDFTYPGADQFALAGVTCEIPGGQVTAVVGASGAGKSTIAALLCGVFRAQSGTILLNAKGGDAKGTIPALARHDVAVVPQEPFLFAGSVAENISFGRPGLGPLDLERAARAAQIHDHIRTLPGGYDAGLDEGGRNLSRGQRQRIALARALVTRPRVLILDEATASLDVASERAVKVAIQSLRGQVTVVIIAHQGELLADIDHVIVLARGRVVQAGPPDGPTIDVDVLASVAHREHGRLVNVKT